MSPGVLTWLAAAAPRARAALLQAALGASLSCSGGGATDEPASAAAGSGGVAASAAGAATGQGSGGTGAGSGPDQGSGGTVTGSAGTESSAGAGSGGAGASGGPGDPMNGSSDDAGFFMWDEATDGAVVEAALARGVRSFRSRDLLIVVDTAAWGVFQAHPGDVDLMAAVPITKPWTDEPIELQPGLLNPTELDPCNDWGDGAEVGLEARLRELDQKVLDKSVELVVAGQMGGAACPRLVTIFETLYELWAGGRAVAWGTTVYPYYYGQDASVETLAGDVDQTISGLSAFAGDGRPVLPLRVLETGWPSACSERATQQNQCAALQSVFDLPTQRGSGVKLYAFELQDYADGWSECEKHFGLFDVLGNDKCDACVDCVQPL
jgi:hypothetical protein